MSRSRTTIPFALSLALAAPALAQADPKFEAGEHLQALSELMEGGEPLSRLLFAHGWPTDAAYQRATLQLAHEAAIQQMAAYLGSGAGLPLSASSYEDLRFQQKARSGSPVSNVQGLVRQELTAYKTLAGATNLQIPANFDPVAIPYQRGRAETSRKWQLGDLATWKWAGTQPPARYGLEALAWGLVCEVRLARLELSVQRSESQAGRDAKYLGRTGEGGFLGLVALHTALAKLHELRSLMVDHRQQSLSIRQNFQGLDEMQYVLAACWTSTASPNGAPAHALVPGESQKSHLFALAGLLIGSCELAALTDPEEGPKSVLELFEGTNAPFEKDAHELAVDTALYAFRALRSLHVNVIKQRPTSLGGPVQRGNTIGTADLGQFILAIRAFRQALATDGEKSPRKDEIAEEQKKAGVLLSTLGGALRGWEADAPGFNDVYSVETNARQSQAKSLAAQGLAVRGLLATHQLASQGGERTPFLEAALRTLRWLDKERWDGAAQAYVESTADGKPSPRVGPGGGLAVLAALRQAARLTGDGRYLERYRQYLETLAGKGLLRAAGDRVAPGFAPEVVLGPGPK